MTYVCPYCGGDRNKPIQGVIQRMWADGCVGAEHNPGGAEFNFADGRRLQITAECNACDERRMLEFLANAPKVTRN